MKGQTRELVLKNALLLFCKEGVDSVATRDIAKQVGISLGNLTYYFPSKNDIILALCNEFIEEIDKELSAERAAGQQVLETYYRQVEAVFYIQLRYRFLFNKRYAEIVTSITDIQTYYQNVLKGRFALWSQLHQEFVQQKLASTALLDDSTALSYVFNILALFWHQEQAIYMPNASDSQRVDHALAVFFQPYKPYLTKKGNTVFNTLIKPLKPYKTTTK